MTQPQLSTESLGEGRYRASVPSLDDQAVVVLALGEAPRVTGGRLADDEATARATFAFLLQHQDGADLPGQIDIEQVVAAYDDAVDTIVALRG